MTQSQEKILRRLWCSMRNRCKQGHKAHSRYYDRGIAVCERWNSFENFLADMGPRPDGATLDRIDNNRGYTPENCRWATWFEQARNKENNVFVSYSGTTQGLAELADKKGVSLSRLRGRLKNGWDINEALTGIQKTGSSEDLVVEGVTRICIAESGMKPSELAKKAGVSVHKIRRWLMRDKRDIGCNEMNALLMLFTGVDLMEWFDLCHQGIAIPAHARLSEKVREYLTLKGLNS